MYDMDTLQKTREWAEAEFGKGSEAMERLAPIFEWREAIGRHHVETVDESSERAFKEKVNRLVSEGYRISSTNCGYVGDVGGSIYDCKYWMAVLVKDGQEECRCPKK